VAVVAAAVVVAMLHVFAVAHHYYVGSFDDDANYILTGRALLAGRGLAGHLPSGDTVVSGYPPGFPALLVPLLWLFPHSFVPLRVFSAACFAAAFPLTWYYLGRRRFPDSVRVAVMGLMALNPVLATFGGMVMAETPFICCALLLLIAVDRWEAGGKVRSPLGLAVVLLAAETVWLKEAGIGMVLGLILWLGLRRQAAKAVAVAAGLGLLLLPVVVARLIDHVPLAGTRYSQELGDYYSGGLLSRLVHVVPSGLTTFFGTALQRSVVEVGPPLPLHGTWYAVIRVVWAQIPVFTILGALVAVRRHRDAAVLVVPVYALETMLYPAVNERRVVLALPIILAWYALGVREAVNWVLRLLRGQRWSRLPARATLGALGVLVVVAPLVAQFPRDYLFGLHQDSSRPQGSRYMAGLRAVGPPSAVVESDYRYTTALFSGHRTADTAFLDELANNDNNNATVNAGCSLSLARTALAADDAGFLLIGALNKPSQIDNACLFSLATSRLSAVRLLRTSRDEASVFELIGPGTGHPDLVNLLSGATLSGSDGLRAVPVRPAGSGDHPGAADSTSIRDGRGVLTWSFGADRAVQQVSVGEAGTIAGVARGVEVQIEVAIGDWVTVAAAPNAVGDSPDHAGDGAGPAPFLLATLPSGTRARAVRVVVHGDGQAIALDVNALGPAGRSAP
jgi:hypothetical protein